MAESQLTPLRRDGRSGLFMTCRRCGQCCNKAMLIMEGCNLAEEKYQDLARWYTLHHCEVRAEEGTGNMAILIPLVCQQLNFNPETGLAMCLIYQTRPQICRGYLCEAAQKRSLEEQP